MSEFYGMFVIHIEAKTIVAISDVSIVIANVLFAIVVGSETLEAYVVII